MIDRGMSCAVARYFNNKCSLTCLTLDNIIIQMKEMKYKTWLRNCGSV